MRKKYTHIFFDLDNTLWNFHKNSENAMKVVFLALKLDTYTSFETFFEVYSRHNKKLWESYRKREVAKKELTRLRFQNTLKELNLKGVDADKMNAFYLSEMPKQKELHNGALDVLKYLKSKGYRLNIITNGFKEVQYKKIESSGLRSFFDKIFISEEIKSHKPERRIFEYAIQSVNAKKSKSIMVGDDYEVDILGALNYGIDSVYFARGLGVLHSIPADPLVYRGGLIKIDTLSRLMAIF